MTRYHRLLLLIFILVTLISKLGCEEPLEATKGSGQGDSDADTDGDGDSDADGDFVPPTVNAEGEVEKRCVTDCTAFPSSPIVESGVPSNPESMFGDKDDFSTPGPCVLEPQLSEGDLPGALFPANWLRPRFRFEPPSGEDLFEIRLAAESQKNDLVAYTTETVWTIPTDIWSELTKSTLDEPVTVTVRGVASGSPGTPSGTRGTFTIAPVVAEGKMVY